MSLALVGKTAAVPETIASRWIDLKGRPAGFDYLRIALATSVLLSHSYQICYGTDAAFALWRTPFGFGLEMILPMFFSLSGFLVCGSLERNRDLRKFLILRVIRIYPALCVEVFISGVLIGPMVTQSSLADYFTAPEFYSYWLNTIGWIHYILPGVFLDNPFPQIVNASLWTVPYELECYIALSVFVLIGYTRSQRVSLAMFAACSVLVLGILYVTGDTGMRPGGTYGRVLVLCFLAGTIVFRLRDRLPYSGPYAFVAGVMGLMMLRFDYVFCLAPFFVAYLTVYLGMLNPKRTIIVSSGDYSYGVYLYAAPIQQTAAWVLGPANVWANNVAVALPVTVLFALFSWYAVEKPFLKVKRYFVR